MKMILSKKGIDGSFCKKPVPIEGVGEPLLFVPIPDNGINQVKDEKTYNDLRMKEKIQEVVKYLKNGDMKSCCHVDPQLCSGCNDDDFLGSIGQIGAAQSHLSNKVSVGDLFLFYGWYKDGDLHSNGKNVLFGYLQVGKIIPVNESQKLTSIESNPHWNKDKYQNVKGNTIYVAKEKLELGEGFDKNLKGYGMFKYSNELDLTDAHKKNRTNWKIEKFRNLKTSCKGRDGKAEFDKNGAYNAPCRCQEIVVDIGDSKDTNNLCRYSEFEIRKWIYYLISNHRIN